VGGFRPLLSGARTVRGCLRPLLHLGLGIAHGGIEARLLVVQRRLVGVARLLKPVLSGLLRVAHALLTVVRRLATAR
jgi:hypothetical protein